MTESEKKVFCGSFCKPKQELSETELKAVCFQCPLLKVDPDYKGHRCGECTHYVEYEYPQGNGTMKGHRCDIGRKTMYNTRRSGSKRVNSSDVACLNFELR